jgi:hypothetical protein
MKEKVCFTASVALVAIPSVFLFEWSTSTALHLSTGFLAGVLAMKAVQMCRESKDSEDESC